MKHKQTFLRLCAGTVALLAAAALTGCGIQRVTNGERSARGAKIAVIGQSEGIQFWDYVEQGAVEAGEELGYEVTYQNAKAVTDIEGQIELVRNAIDSGAQAIVIAPNSSSELNDVIRDAGDAGIAVVTIDADVDSTEIRSAYIGTQNSSAGAIAARQALTYLQENMEGASIGKVGIIGHSDSSLAALQRVGGFQSELTERLRASFRAIKAGDEAAGGNSGAPAPGGGNSEGGAPEINEEEIAASVDVEGLSEEEAKAAIEQAIADAKAAAGGASEGGAPEGGTPEGGAPEGGTPEGGAPAGGMTEAQLAAEMNPVVGVRFCDGDADIAKAQAKELLEQFPNIQVLYATNERSTIGVCEAVKEMDLSGKIMVIGFNSNSSEIEYIRNDVLTGTIVQNPYNMGYLGVYYAGHLLTEQDVPGNVDTGATYVYKQNLNSKEIALLLDPSAAVKTSSKTTKEGE